MLFVKSFSFPEGEIRGDMFYIKHFSNNFTVIDCYLKDDGVIARKDEIIEEIIRESSGRICRFISTHPDNDHIAGLECLDERWRIENFYAVTNDIPADKGNARLVRYKKLMSEKNFAVQRGIKRAWLNVDNDENGSSGINFEWPDVSNAKFRTMLESVKTGQNINNICPIFTYKIKDGQHICGWVT